jgi:hypothetical protein
VLEGPEGEEPMRLWIKALNKFQREDAVRAGLVASQMTRMLYRPGHPDYDALVASLAEDETSDEELAYAYIGALKSHQIWMDAERDVLTLPYWSDDEVDRELILNELSRKNDESPELMSEDEKGLLLELNQRWMADWVSQSEIRVAAEYSLAMEKSRESRINDCIMALVGLRTSEAQISSYDRVAVHHATRICNGVETEQGVNHDDCDRHSELLFPEPRYVADVEEHIIAPIIDALNYLDTAADALGGEAPQRARR